MPEMPKYINPVSLIPGGCPQLLDYSLPAEAIEKIRYAFVEAREAAAGNERVLLHAFRRNADNEYADEINPEKICDNYDYEIAATKAIQPWLNQWLPIPFLRVRDQTWPDSGECRFDYGPSNWARARLCQDSSTPGNLRLVLAFDMQTEDREGDNYVALSRADVDANAHFKLAWRFRDNSWFMDLAWVEEWLAELWHAWQHKKRIRDDEDRRFEHLASYLVYLEVIEVVSQNCGVYMVRPDGQCVETDLVLDIGNSRTTGLIVETQVQSTTSLNNSYLLQLRDMDQPDKIYAEPFDTRVEFSEIQFGNDALSMRSGRKTPAFAWPSPVRIGPEAGRLATLSRCAKGSTGMSSPKRYLWDERDWQRTWRYNTKSENSPYVTRGPLVQQVNSSGTPLCCMNDKSFTRNPILRKQDTESAFESLFTRSSLMMFLFVEIIQQALLTINSPGQRSRQEFRAKPRRLRQIIFTFPAGMPMAEQKIYRRWGIWAVHVLWEALGWEQFYLGNKKPARTQVTDYRLSPFVRCDWDEATSTQLVYAYNEIVHKFQGDARLFCDLAGRKRKFGDRESPSIRIAAIDIGGGTTDLSITTFELASEEGSSSRLAAHPVFHDGFNLAGDDILRAVIADHILPAIGDAVLKNSAESQRLLQALFGRAPMNTSVAFLNQRIQFVRQIAMPAGLYLLALYERADLARSDEIISFRLGDCFRGGDQSAQTESGLPVFPMPGSAALSFLYDWLPDAPEFDILETVISADPGAMNDTVRDTLKDVLANLCEVINIYDCDALLLTGRPSRWPGVINTVASLLPVPPSRIIPMSDYRVGAWYPFSDTSGRLTDPKTTVVVGAILCALAEGQLENFAFDPRNLHVLPTARHIGEMELNGQIRKNKVWFHVDPETNTSDPEVREVVFNGPISVGFRQLDAERWTTTRFYMLDYADSQQAGMGRLNLPLRVKLRLELKDNENDERDEGEFKIEEIVDAAGESVSSNLLEIRLQTLPRDDGFWVDTGTIYEN